MRIGSNHDGAGPDIAVFGQDLVADAADIAANIMKAGDLLGGDEVARFLLVGGGFGRLCRDAVVEDNGDPVCIPNDG
jgi:hypothetical protein